MFVDQQNMFSVDITRLLSQNSYAYEDFLYDLLGREFVLANPAEIRGPMKVKASFVAKKAADGEKDAPRIDIWVEFNPAMGLLTTWGEYYNGKDDGPVVKGSPRTDDEDLLKRPARMFDWLVHSLSGYPSEMFAQVQSALGGMMTPAGAIESVELVNEEDCGCMYKLEPEFRLPQAYFVNGTEFPGPYGGHAPYAASLSLNQWEDLYATPVGSAVQHTVDNLYGVGTFKVSVDAYGFVLLHPLHATPTQNFNGFSAPNLPPPQVEVPVMDRPRYRPAMPAQEEKSWFASEILRMAGVDGREKLQDRRLDEKYSGGTIPLLKGPKKEKERLRVNPPTKDSPKSHKDLWAKIYTSSGEGDDAQTARIVATIVSRSGGKSKKKAAPAEESSISSRMRALLSEDSDE